MVPFAIADAIVQGFRGSRTSPDFFLAFQSRALWGVGAGTPLGRALACVHRILSNHLATSPNDSGDDVVGAMAAVGVLYDEVWRLNPLNEESNEAGGGGDRAVPSSYARAAIAYLLALASRRRERIIAECSDGDGGDGGFGTLESAAAARQSSGPKSPRRYFRIRRLGRVDELRKPPWIGAMETHDRAKARGGRRRRRGRRGDSFRPAAASSRRAAASSASSREASRVGFELAWRVSARRRGGRRGNRGNRRRVAQTRIQRVLARGDGLHRREDERARRGERVARLRRASSLRCSPARPADDDPGWTHSALYVAPSETARRRYRLRMSYGRLGTVASRMARRMASRSRL